MRIHEQSLEKARVVEACRFTAIISPKVERFSLNVTVKQLSPFFLKQLFSVGFHAVCIINSSNVNTCLLHSFKILLSLSPDPFAVLFQ